MQGRVFSHIRLRYRIGVKAILWFDRISEGRPVTDVTDVTLLAEKSRMKKKGIWEKVMFFHVF